MVETETCKMALLVQADFDGELDAVQSMEMEKHRAQCASCQRSYAEMALVRESLQAASLKYTAPAALRDSLTRGKASSKVPVIRRLAWVGRPALSFGLGAALAASVMLAILPGRDNGLVDQVLASHVRALQPGHLEDVVSTDQHTVKPWFDGRIDFAPPVKNLIAEGYPLDGGRLDYLAGRPVAAMVYMRGKHPINLYVWPSPGAADSAPSNHTRNGYNMYNFVHNEMTVWVISDLERSQLETFVQLWQSVN